MTETAIQDTLDIATIISLILFLNFAASLLIFAKFGMRPLGKKLQELHKDTVSQWDAFGWRVVTYAIKLSVPATFWGEKGEYKMLLDPFLLHQIATRRHRLLAIWNLSSFLIFIVYAVIYVEML
ncbi:hypothetical protein [Alkalimonas sp.]|uniref:hypothetical protein n=1 Tax=Alkalimonas sp. TaxID=1872453 RepID=UPI00263B7CC8|nr:hypothetical protein [Alkalimonas sp.]MCC5827461.1 hypothetical protein [Alkalimonas sp.]